MSKPLFVHPADRARPRVGLPTLCGLAGVVGIVTGVGALVFRVMISLIHNLFFLGRLSLVYDSSRFTPPSP